VPREVPESPQAESSSEPQREQTFSLEALLEQTRAANAAAGTGAGGDAAQPEAVEDEPVPIFVPADQFDAVNSP